MELLTSRFTRRDFLRWSGTVAAVLLGGLASERGHALISASAELARVNWGMWLPQWQRDGGVQDSVLLDAETSLGHRISPVHWFAADTESWDYDDVMTTSLLSLGRVPLITREFWHSSLGSIAAGAVDDVPETGLRAWARGMKAHAPSEILLRIFHEFNDPNRSQGSGYPWSVASGTENSPSDLVAAWRHVVSVFRAEGAGNVRFCWCPDGTFSGTSMHPGSSSPPLSAAYPGDEWVDYVGWDDYGYDTGALYSAMQQVAPGKQIILAEVQSFDIGWIKGLSQLANDGNHGNLHSVVWFDEGRQYLAESPSVRAAVKEMLQTPAFQTSSAGEA